MTSLIKPAYAARKPTESDERNRLNLQHEIWLLSLKGSLCGPGIPEDFEPRSVLDIGCGSGVWALAYAQQHPNCQVYASDVHPPVIQEKPINLIIIDHSVNVEQASEWPPNQTFDYIHLRMLTIALTDWRSVLELCWQHLEPGGWIELNDIQIPYRAENPSASAETSTFLRAAYLEVQAQEMNGVDLTAPRHHQDKLKLKGFQNVGQTYFKWPLNGDWPEDNVYKRIGSLTFESWTTVIRSYWVRLVCANLKMDVDHATKMLEEAIAEIKTDFTMRFYIRMLVTTGQKPCSLQNVPI